MKTVLMNIMDEFKELCVLVPRDESLEAHDQDVERDAKKWILLRAPWQPKLPDEDLIPRPKEQPPRSLVDRFKAILSQWFYKDTLANPYEQ